MGEMPLGRTAVGHRLDDVVFDFKGFAQLLGEGADAPEVVREGRPGECGGRSRKEVDMASLE